MLFKSVDKIEHLVYQEDLLQVRRDQSFRDLLICASCADMCILNKLLHIYLFYRTCKVKILNITCKLGTVWDQRTTLSCKRDPGTVVVEVRV